MLLQLRETVLEITRVNLRIALKAEIQKIILLELAKTEEQ
jgi:hypothetical protein